MLVSRPWRCLTSSLLSPSLRSISLSSYASLTSSCPSWGLTKWDTLTTSSGGCLANARNIFINIFNFSLLIVTVYNPVCFAFSFRLAKSTLTLIPLLGSHLVLFSFITDESTSNGAVTLRLTKMFIDLVFNSVQVTQEFLWTHSNIVYWIVSTQSEPGFRSNCILFASF